MSHAASHPDVPPGHPAHDDSASDHVQHGETLQTYFVIYGSLMVLLILTQVASYVHLGHKGNLALAMTIACTKGLLVVLFFMHVRLASRLTWVFASAAFLWLAILFVVTFPDFFTRPYSPGGKLTPEPYPTEQRESQGPGGVETNRALVPDQPGRMQATTPFESRTNPTTA